VTCKVEKDEELRLRIVIWLGVFFNLSGARPPERLCPLRLAVSGACPQQCPEYKGLMWFFFG
jgi:hypothetical protein